MQIRKEGSFYRASMVTGPRHNTLLISFADDQNPCDPRIEVLPPIGDCQHPPLNSNAVLQAVLEGVEKVNEKWNAGYRVAVIEYVENDTGPESTYGYLAEKIVEHIATAV